MVGDFSRMLGYCDAGQPFTTTSGTVTQHWTPTAVTTDATDPLSTATRVGAGATRQEPPARSCYHAALARANVTVESIVCGDTDSAAAANQLVDRISAKLPR
ncbi:hypothetical protein BST28_07355 [Mycolicibacter kumamotonensis]|uniref:PknH-like extracellular domain-containing protein n=2 Tax=Mycobacteriaceae TaxID=1762 RepID=A0A1X1W6D2_MYCIR|nr:hypothetical protein BST28_07355 [Mycolicibacter kumamotonensis]ORV82173.1 hypothetical protein AWC12_00795 [Mycolicibacterium iranicum]